MWAPVLEPPLIERHVLEGIFIVDCNGAVPAAPYPPPDMVVDRPAVGPA